MPVVWIMAICSSLWNSCRGRTGRESMAGKAARPRSHPCAAGGNTGAVQTHTPCAARAHRNTGPAAVSGKQTPGARAQHKANPISSRASTKARWVQGGRRAGGGEAPPGGTLALALAPSRAPIDAAGRRTEPMKLSGVPVPRARKPPVPVLVRTVVRVSSSRACSPSERRGSGVLLASRFF